MSDGTLPLFYQSPRVITPATHGDRSIRRGVHLGFAAQTNALPLVAAEMPVAARHYPVVFTQEAVPHPVAIVGLRAQHNLYVGADGQWQAGAYVPAYVRRYPFIFFEHDGGLTLCLDDAAEAVIEGREHPLFDDKGEPTPLTQSALAFCRDYQAQHQATVAFAQALKDADLLVERRADVTFKDGQRTSLAGFNVIDEQRFAQLPDDTLLQWRRNGWLALVYSHFFSLGAWSALIDREIQA